MNGKTKKEVPTERVVYEVRTPVSDFSGDRFGMLIRDGRGTTSDERIARACLAAGYRVTVDGKPLE